MTDTPHELTGHSLTQESLAEIALPGGCVSLSDGGREVMSRARRVIDKAVSDQIAVYGVTTGLGSRATEVLSADALAGFSLETLNGRANAMGEALPAQTVRAAMVVRLNSMLLGASGVAPSIADHLMAVYNAGLVPVVGQYGSIGAADLLLGATMGRAVMGIGGRIQIPGGEVLEASEALDSAGLTAPPLGPRDGLALANHACFSAASTALALAAATRMLTTSFRITGLSMLGFQANVTPFDPAVIALKPHDGDRRAAQILCDLLAGSVIENPANARRLQDPISLRNAVQVYGAALRAMDMAQDCVHVEINGSSDNPAVLWQDGRVISTGNYHTPHLTLASETTSRSLAAVATMSVSRIARLCTERLSGLPMYLADPDQGTNGFAPLLKLAESLLAGIHRCAQPIAPWPSINADGAEDGLTNAMQAARSLSELITLFAQLSALEALVAAQAIDLRGIALSLALEKPYGAIRALSSRIRQSRPLADEIEAVANAIHAGDL